MFTVLMSDCQLLLVYFVSSVFTGTLVFLCLAGISCCDALFAHIYVDVEVFLGDGALVPPRVHLLPRRLLWCLLSGIDFLHSYDGRFFAPFG